MSLTAYGAVAAVLHILIELAVIARVLLRPNRQPASRIAWIVVIAALPVVGILAYLLFGETSIGRRRIARMHSVIAAMPDFPAAAPGDEANLEANVPDIDAAEQHIHLLFYIWLADGNGCKIVEALKRAVDRGVICRAMADDLGSRTMIHSPHWQAMQDTGVHVAVALPIGNPLLRPFRGRIDLRDHRKIVVIDGRVTYCGSQNCADPEFRVKPKYAPWVDIMMRFEGPIATQNQFLFARDWETYTGENLDTLLRQPIPAPQPGFPAQVVASGPTARSSAMSEMFQSLMHAARSKLVITTPYYVPD
jgi:cardiolipin synthase